MVAAPGPSPPHLIGRPLLVVVCNVSAAIVASPPDGAAPVHAMHSRPTMRSFHASLASLLVCVTVASACDDSDDNNGNSRDQAMSEGDARGQQVSSQART